MALKVLSIWHQKLKRVAESGMWMSNSRRSKRWMAAFLTVFCNQSEFTWRLWSPSLTGQNFNLLWSRSYVLKRQHPKSILCEPYGHGATCAYWDMVIRLQSALVILSYWNWIWPKREKFGQRKRWYRQNRYVVCGKFYRRNTGLLVDGLVLVLFFIHLWFFYSHLVK